MNLMLCENLREVVKNEGRHIGRLIDIRDAVVPNTSFSD
jgi:GMP synthase PP-ATPase subunit